MSKHSNHANSHIVTIFRAGSFLARVQGKEGEEYMNMGKMSIGAYFVDSNTAVNASGLTAKEEDLLVPQFIDCDPGEREYRKLKGEFFASIDTKIPAVTGCRLQIGLEENNEAEVSKSNMPLEPMDYIRYKHALRHPEVAKDKEEADSRAIKKYYIFDPTSVQKKKTKGVQEKDAAIRVYLSVKEDLEKVDGLLTLLGIDIREFSGTEEQKTTKKVERLRELAEGKPEDFITASALKDFELQHLIRRMLNCGVFAYVGPKIVDAESRNTIGHNMEEAVAFFQDDKNSEAVILYKSRLQEYMKRPIEVPKKKTVVK